MPAVPGPLALGRNVSVTVVEQLQVDHCTVASVPISTPFIEPMLASRRLTPPDRQSPSHPRDLIENRPIGKMRFVRLVPAAERCLDREELELDELVAMTCEHLGVGWSEVMFRRELLSRRRVKKAQVSLGDLARAAAVDDCVDDGHGRLREDAYGGHDDLDMVVTERLKSEQRLVLPCEQHIANVSLDERVRRA